MIATTAESTYLTRLSIVLARNPPLGLKLQISLEESEQVGRRHGAAGEEVSAHPALLEVVWSGLVSKDVDKQLSRRLQSSCDLGHEKFIVLHVLEHLLVLVKVTH